ncbi:MAG: SpoIIE family protein phosphatase, partial [Endozoicomonadaceae bacterium]|nr:SpoIIE family protein phosphatase [Endozoicomonadaceae bacterium]
MANQQLKRDKNFWCTQIQGTRNYQEDDSGFDDSHPGLLLMLLADGMGGYAGGDIASKKALEVFANSFNPEDDRTTPERLEYALNQANRVLAKTIREKPELEGMGCTFVGAVLSHENTRLHWISVGDSPLWVYRNNSLIRLNIDHSKRIDLEEQVRKGEITAQEAATHPERNSLTSALTGEPPALVDNNSRGIEPDDILLLASDGLFTLPIKEIEQKLSNSTDNTAEEIVNKLLKMVKKKKKRGQDNTTALIVKIPPPSKNSLSMAAQEIPTTLQQKEKTTLNWKYIIGSFLFLLALAGAFFAGKNFSENDITKNTEQKKDTKKTIIGDYIKENDPEKVDPEKTDPEKTDPEKTDPEKANPEKTDPKKTDSEKIDSEKADPEKTDPEKADPEKTNPEKTDPEKTDPEKTDPEKTDPEKTDPEKTDPEKTD